MTRHRTMTGNTTTDDRYPTTGPDEGRYDSYRYTTTGDGAALVYHVDNEDEWVQADEARALADWR